MKRFKFILTAFLMAVSIAAFAQKTITVKGTVTDASTGEPLSGAAILIKGTPQGTIADADGRYSVNVASDGTLGFTTIGFKDTEIAVNGRSVIDIALEPDVTALEEVVVTAYGTTTKGAFTGSAKTVKSEEIEKRQVSNVSNALSGQVAGVQVLSANGQPGVDATIRIRGIGSINAGTSPLYIVDGIPFDGDLSSINTQDIESVTVQKDAVSTALYGARGANGVIMITTKKGKSGDAVVNFEARLGANSRAVKNYDVMTSTQEYVEKAYEAIYNAAFYNIGASKGNAALSNQYANSKIFTNTGGGFGYQIYTLPTGESLIGQDGKLNPAAQLGFSDGTNYYIPDDWSAETFSNKMRQEYNLNISGATDKFNYYASFGYLDDQGIIDNSGFSRLSGRLKADYQVKKWLKVGGNFAYTNSKSRYPGEQTTTNSSGNAFFLANQIAPVYPIFVRDASGNILYNEHYNRPVYDYGDATQTAFKRAFMSISNPKGDLMYNTEEYLMDIMNLNWFADLKPVKGLTISARFNLHADNTRYNNLGNAFYGQSAEYGGTAYQEAARTQGFDQQYTANYNVTFGNRGKHTIDVTAGYEDYSYLSTFVDATGQNLYNVDSYYVNNTIDQRLGYGGKNEYATKGIFGFINYNFNSKYYATFSYRRDASSRFAPENRWGNFFSGSAAWIISQEDFMKGASNVDILKLKASLGQQGNDNLGNYYPYLDQFKMTGSNGIFSDATLYYKGNHDITWETQTSYNVGLEFGFWNKLSGAIEYWGRKSGNMLYYKPTAPILGYSSVPMNVGSMSNTGVELELNYTPFKNKNFSWVINFNGTYQKNKILKLHEELNGKWIDGSRIYEEGYSMYRLYLVKYAGVNPETGEAQYWAKDDEKGEYKTADWSVASSTNKCATEDILPKFYGGFGTGFNIFGVDLSIQLAYQLGGKIMDSGYQRLMHGGTSSYAGTNWHTDIRKAWTPSNTNTDVPRVDASDQYAISTSDRWLTSSNYLSINNISAGYTLPSKFTKKFGVEKLRLSMSADNVAIFSARKGLDPRQSYTSATTALYTPIRTVSGGIQITF